MQFALSRDEGLSNGFIHNILKNELKCHSFIGVYAANDIDIEKVQESNEFIFICNLSPREHPGTHFVTIIGDRKQLLYCDSLALPIHTSQDLLNSLKKIGKRKMSTLIMTPIQSALSDFCGIYAIYFVLLFDYVRFPIVTEQNKFSKTHLRENDFICVENIKQIIKKNI